MTRSQNEKGWECQPFRGRGKVAQTLVLCAITSIPAAACQTNQPGVEVRTVEVVKEVAAPCPATPPVRPEPLGPLPEHAVQALAVALAKLAEWSAPGQFGDQAELYFETCPPSE